MSFITYIKYCIKKRERPSLNHYIECLDAIEKGELEGKEWIN